MRLGVTNMPITMAEIDKSYKIVRISGTDAIHQHLKEIGFVDGEEIKVISNNAGNIIVQVKEARIALDAKMANRIIVA